MPRRKSGICRKSSCQNEHSHAYTYLKKAWWRDHASPSQSRSHGIALQGFRNILPKYTQKNWARKACPWLSILISQLVPDQRKTRLIYSESLRRFLVIGGMGDKHDLQGPARPPRYHIDKNMEDVEDAARRFRYCIGGDLPTKTCRSQAPQISFSVFLYRLWERCSRSVEWSVPVLEQATLSRIYSLQTIFRA